MAARKCKGTTKTGKPCKAVPIEGGDYCISHADKKTQERLGFGGSQPNAGRPKSLRVVDVMRQRIEEQIDAIIEPYMEEALTAAQLERVPDEEKPGELKWVAVPDHGRRIAAAEKLLDRAYGRPMQQTEITGGGGGPVRTVDLSKLSTEDLEALDRIEKRLKGDG
jgi:hypothetical protein